MTQSFVQDEEYIRSRERQNAQMMVKDAHRSGKLADDVYQELIRLAESNVSAYVVYGTLAYFQVQEPIGSRFHNARRLPTIVGIQSGRVHQ